MFSVVRDFMLDNRDRRDGKEREDCFSFLKMELPPKFV